MRPQNLPQQDVPEAEAALRDTVTMILAGGQGERLYPLTRDRAKPAVPFAGDFRLIDFTLSNCLNSGMRRVHVLTQYKSDSLNRHIRLGWNVYNPELGEYVEVNPPQMRLTSHWYLGTADAIHQNIYALEHERPDQVLILSGDHVYKMDYCPMLGQHLENDADLTIACIEVPRHEASRLGVLSVDDEMRTLALDEKPDEPTVFPGSVERTGRPMSLCSMGVYIFDTETLVRRVVEDSKSSTSHDFGRDVIPAMLEAGDRVFAYRFAACAAGKKPYWRDVGTLDVYWEAHMQLLSDSPPMNLHDPQWPLRTYVPNAPPVQAICGDHQTGEGPTHICNSLLCNGAMIDRAQVRRSVLGPNVRINPGSVVEDSVILARCHVGRDAVVRKTVLDKANRVPDGFQLGVDREQDQRHFTISEGGVVVVPKEMPLFSQT